MAYSTRKIICPDCKKEKLYGAKGLCHSCYCKLLYRTKENYKNKCKEYRDKNKEKHMEYVREYRKNYEKNEDVLKKRYSRNMAYIHFKGISYPCEICGSVNDIEKHHEDYKKPLEVNWLCRICHVNKRVEKYDKRI